MFTTSSEQLKLFTRLCYIYTTNSYKRLQYSNKRIRGKDEKQPVIKIRHIHTRISEHMGVSPLTGKKRSVSTMSGILAHIHTTKHQISPSDFKILSTGTSETDLLIRESLFISKLNPILNANIRSAPLDLF